MNSIKSISGLIWMALGLAAIYLMAKQAGSEISAAVKANKAVLDTQMFWYIIIPIFTPIMLGLCLFGWYALKGEYGTVPRDSAHLDVD
jgi:hypothetical protein